MTIELIPDEAREVALVLRHFYDASVVHPGGVPEQHFLILASVIAKLQDGLNISATPWEEPHKYENVS